ncbi:hypothetical protein VHEMI00664 [[Torrubiella] hemipterigena]|uniref:GYF domain-containing protein n=1 Tax=[Torrubiella] hemipterigena TaxID=1531966 RepID=A0A0A1T2Z4_9HYPO|nr:hypothetical protein VHEMI00664 [[Torrubiella] hemipterigena]
MASRHSAARPSRNGENFARTHHHDDNEAGDLKFDVRNPSALAPDAREDDAILDADVIGGSHATKRGAVNLDGYDSDSDNDNFNARAGSRKKREVNIIDQLDNYDAKEDNTEANKSKYNDDDDDDMFAASGGDDDVNTNEDAKQEKKKVQFLDSKEITGQELNSRSGGTIRIDQDGSSDDESDKELAMEEEGVDEEVGAGGLKRNAPKVEAFNLRDEMEDGRFDDSGNYVRKAGDPDAVHDTWLEGLSKKDLKKAATAHEKRQEEARKQRIEDDSLSVPDLLKKLILQLEKAETPLEALARLGKTQPKSKKIPAWKLKKLNKAKSDMDIDSSATSEVDAAAARIKTAIDAITDAADKLLSRGHEDIYDQERELLVREYRRESGEEWVEPKQPEEDTGTITVQTTGDWNFRWVAGDGAVQGPFDGPTMKAWQDAGYFKQGVEIRRVNDDGEWLKSVTFE